MNIFIAKQKGNQACLGFFFILSGFIYFKYEKYKYEVYV